MNCLSRKLLEHISFLESLFKIAIVDFQMDLLALEQEHSEKEESVGEGRSTLILLHCSLIFHGCYGLQNKCFVYSNHFITPY